MRRSLAETAKKRRRERWDPYLPLVSSKPAANNSIWTQPLCSDGETVGSDHHWPPTAAVATCHGLSDWSVMRSVISTKEFTKGSNDFLPCSSLVSKKAHYSTYLYLRLIFKGFVFDLDKCVPLIIRFVSQSHNFKATKQKDVFAFFLYNVQCTKPADNSWLS